MKARVWVGLGAALVIGSAQVQATDVASLAGSWASEWAEATSPQQTTDGQAQWRDLARRNGDIEARFQGSFDALSFGFPCNQGGFCGALIRDGHVIERFRLQPGRAHDISRPLVMSTAVQKQANPVASSTNVDYLAGLWGAKKRFGPDARGTLTIRRDVIGYTAELIGRLMPVHTNQGELTFDLPNGQGTFKGRFEGKDIFGYWIASGWSGSATPVRLKAAGDGSWRGEVAPLPDEFTFYLLARNRPDGAVDVVLRNPERDLGAQIDAQRLVRDGNSIKLLGKERELASGTNDSDRQTFSLYFPTRGGTYDFRREGDESDFYPRGKNPGRYVYRAPPALDDGWSTAGLEDVNIDRAGAEQFIQMLLDMPMDSVEAPQIHGILVARHGKLVLEEYFHGYHRGLLHTTRSGSKSITATIVGAAMHAGAPLKLSSPVFQIMNGGTFPAGLEPAKRSMTLDNLLNMKSGFFCDDNSENAPGREDYMWDQTEEPDFYGFYMKLPMDRQAGERLVYCSGDSNLALGMVGRATGENPMDLFERLIARPMKIDHYVWSLDRAGQPYGGGGMQFHLRDYMKFSQLLLNGGTWGGHRILSRDFVAAVSAPREELSVFKYGYLWWGADYPYQGRTVRAFFASGLGGQAAVAVPELDLVVALYGGNYASAANWYWHKILMPVILATIPAEPRRAAER